LFIILGGKKEKNITKLYKYRCASKGTIDMCNLCDDKCTRCWRKFKVNYKKHVIGIEVDEEKDDEEQLMKEAELV
jgi:hypothetical protein